MKVIFLNRLYVEIITGLISDSEFNNRPTIDIFDTQKSDQDKITDYIKSEFNYAFRVICQQDRNVRQLLTGKRSNIPTKYLQYYHLLDSDDIQKLTSDIYLNFFVGKDADYLHYVAEYLNGCGVILTDQDADKYLQLMNLNSLAEYKNWVKKVRPNFLTNDQIENFCNNANGTGYVSNCDLAVEKIKNKIKN